MNLFGIPAFSPRASARCSRRRRSRSLQHGAFFLSDGSSAAAHRAVRFAYLLVVEPGAVGDDESGGFPALSLGTAGPPGGFVGPVLFRLPAVLPVVVPFDIPVFLPVFLPVFVPVAACPEAAAPGIPGFEIPPPLVAVPVCARADVAESASAEASATVAIFMIVFLWSRQDQQEAPQFVPAVDAARRCGLCVP
jgi:hypothetical protein